MFPTCLTVCPGVLPLNVGWLAGLLCTFGSCPTHFLSGGHHRHFALIARHSPTECSLFVCLFASLSELLVIYSLFFRGRKLRQPLSGFIELATRLVHYHAGLDVEPYLAGFS